MLKLRQYQLEAVDFLGRRNGLLVLDCGLGKTVTAVKAIDQDMQGLVLWLCRKSAVTQTIDEIASNSAVCDVVLTATDFIARRREYEADSLVYVVAYYEELRKGELESFFWDWIVADEAHALRNIKTKRYGVIKKMSSRRRIGLTATPAKKAVGYQNGKRVSALSPREMYGILRFLYPTQFNSHLRFLEMFWQQIGWDGIIINYEKYSKTLADLLFVRSAAEVGLVHKESILVNVEPSKAERKLYDELRRQAAEDIIIKIEEIKDLSLVTSKAVLLTRLQQLTSMPALLGATDISPCKVEWLDDNIDNLVERGVVIMTRFVKTAEFIGKRYGLAVHTGDRRDKIVDGQTMGLVGTAQSMGDSLNFWWLQNLVLYDQIWSGMHRHQALSRIMRLKGGVEHKLVFELLMSDTIDKYIHRYSLDSFIQLTELQNMIAHIKGE